jgi:hypothetical protein
MPAMSRDKKVEFWRLLAILIPGLLKIGESCCWEIKYPGVKSLFDKMKIL